MRLIVRLAVTLSLLTALFATTTEAANAEGEMTDEQAAPIFLAAACKSDAADIRFLVAVFRANNSATLRQIRNRMVAIHRTAKSLAAADLAFSQSLNNPPAPWPVDVQAPIASISSLRARLSVVHSHIARTRTPRGVIYWYNRRVRLVNAERAPMGTVRTNLGLPSAGVVC